MFVQLYFEKYRLSNGFSQLSARSLETADVVDYLTRPVCLPKTAEYLNRLNPSRSVFTGYWH